MLLSIVNSEWEYMMCGCKGELYPFGNNTYSEVYCMLRLELHVITKTLCKGANIMEGFDKSIQRELRFCS